jgi:hypothetical protein
MKKILSFLLAGLIIFPAIIIANEPQKLSQAVSREYNGISICVSPQVELISIVQIISKYPSFLGFLMSKDSSDYKTEVVNHFETYKNHPAVLMFDRLSMKPRMLNFSAPSNIMLYTGETLELRNDILPDEFVINRAGGTDSLKQFLILLKDFADKSAFNEFFRNHNKFYLSIIENTIRNMGSADYITEIESFFGTSQKSYNIILVSLYNFVGYGNSLLFSDGKREIYNTMGPKTVIADIPFFGEENYLKYLIRHEFSHPFVNPLTEKYWDYIKDYSHNYDSVPEATRRNVCGDWQECINEFTIRSVTTSLAFNESEDGGSAAYKKESSKGVTNLDSLLEKIKYYQENREKFKTFDSFYPEILDAFKL